MHDTIRYLTSYRPGRKGEFNAAIEPFDLDALQAVLEQPVALLTIGSGTRPSPAALLDQLRRLAGRQSSAGRPPTWEWLTRDPKTHRIVRRHVQSDKDIVRHLAAELREAPADTAALVATPVFELLDEKVTEELLDGPETLPDDRRAEAGNRARLLEARSALLAQVPTCTSEQLAELRGSTTSNASQLGQDLRKSGKVVGVRHGKSWHYPRFQFDRKGKPCPEVAEILSALGRDADPWDVLQWFAEPNALLDGRKPHETWARDRRAVVQAARGAHWAARD